MSIRDEKPLLAYQEGVWDGTYTNYIDSGDRVGQHSSHLFCRFEREADETRYHPTSYYGWPDGRTDTRIWWADAAMEARAG